MMILAIRTDKPEAELYLSDGHAVIATEVWQAHRALAETLHTKLSSILRQQGSNWGDISGIVVFQGPGSFTGLRIGISVANALAESLVVPIVGAMGESWVLTGVSQIQNGMNQKQVIPEYGAPVHITPSKQ